MQLSAGFSSLERFIINASIRQRNFRGKGQELRASINYSSFSKSVELGFTEPYLFDKNIALGGDIFRRDQSSFNFNQNRRDTNYSQITTGLQVRIGVPLTEYWSVAGRYGLSFDDIGIARTFLDQQGNCDPFIAGRYLCDAIGKRTTSSLGYSLVFDNLNNRQRPTRGQRFVLSQDFAGLGGSVKYLRTRFDAAKYWRVLGNFTFSAALEGGFIVPFGASRGAGIDKVRLTDRFYLGEPEIRGFDIRGVGPRIQRQIYDTTTRTFLVNRNQVSDDALGGRAYYKGRAELEIPLGAGAKGLGLRPSLFMDFGAVFRVTKPTVTTIDFFRNPANIGTDGLGVITTRCRDAAGAITFAPATGCDPNTQSPINPFQEVFLGDSIKPRLSVGFGVNWNSPFGPFRIDIAKALLKQPGDRTKLFTFNVGTQF